MKNFSEDHGREAFLNLKRMETALSKAEEEWANIVAKFKDGFSANDDERRSVTDLALAVANGEKIDLNEGCPLRKHGKREVELRNEIAVLKAAIGKQKADIELIRTRARAELYRNHPKLKEAGSLFNQAMQLLQQAIMVEEEANSELVSHEYGLSEPMVTNAVWLNRDLVMMVKDQKHAA